MRQLCLFISLLMMGCKPSVEILPILSYTVDDSGEKKYFNITYSNFTNHLGQDFTDENLKGKIVVANFFFTQCPSICPPMRTALITVAKEYEHDENVLIISHTIDPKNDSISALNNYSQNTDIESNKWQFLKSHESQTKALAKQYMTNFRPNEKGTDFYHSSYVALVDTQQQIRGFYNVLVEEELLRLKQDISILLKN